MISERSEDFNHGATLGREPLISEGSEDFSRGADERPGTDVGAIILEREFPFPERTSITSEGSLQLRS